MNETFEPAEVKRDEDGQWSHPGMPIFDEDQQAFRDWVDAQGLELSVDDLESFPDHPAHKRYFEEGSSDFSDWSPERPRGDGWFTLSVHMTEDSAVWIWARRKEAHAAEQVPA